MLYKAVQVVIFFVFFFDYKNARRFKRQCWGVVTAHARRLFVFAPKNTELCISYLRIVAMATSVKSHNILDTPIEYLKGVGAKRAEMLQKDLQIFTFGDLLNHFPFRYIDKTQLHLIADLNPDSPYIQVKGRLSTPNLLGEGRTRRLSAYLTDDQGDSIELVWFQNAAAVKTYLKAGGIYIAFGRPNQYRDKWSLPHPEMEAIDDEASIDLAARIQPVYSTTEKLKMRGLDSKSLHRLLRTLIDKLQPDTDIPETLPPYLVENQQLMPRSQAYCDIHLPQNENRIAAARQRLKFDELFFLQLRLCKIKTDRHLKTEGLIFGQIGAYFNRFYAEMLPFELTNAQKRVLKEIRRDVATGYQMNRLVQGDVGSGKTIVALMAMLMAIDNGYQACMMAPTEILAQQHYEKIQPLVEPLGLRCELLTGSMKSKKLRRRIAEGLLLGTTHLLIGTHALIEDGVQFKDLGLAVVDEQHRFGVEQRAKLWQKNNIEPHVLVMTATPIPRTLAMTLYGDLDVSVIDELPPGRKPIKTVHYYESKRLMVFEFLRSEIAKGRQIYMVYPLINESETLSYKNLMEGYEAVSRAFPIPQYQISIVHGQMHTVDKDTEMQRFKEGETHIMVATTVIEVGVDVPNASVMVIESAERFGLSQLHQLRGRVGRGAEQSYCILMTGEKVSADGKLRMKTMVDTTDGFKISEVDMNLRGAGDIGGTQQSGMINLRLADIVKDQQLLVQVRNLAQDILAADPQLQLPEHQATRHYLAAMQQQRSVWSRIS